MTLYVGSEFSGKKLMEETRVSNKYGQWRLLTRCIFYILPQVGKELKEWKNFLAASPPSPLHRQALNSIRTKRFHCQGGAVYALLNSEAQHHLLPLIVSLQTISDYLDNLCDRITWNVDLNTSIGREIPSLSSRITWDELSSLSDREKDRLMERGFRQLHLSMAVALKPQDLLREDYYKYYPLREDGGYLEALVNCSRKHLSALPVYEEVQKKVIFLANLYCDLQALKHLSLQHRREYLEEWFQTHHHKYPFLLWNEFAAAAGSTLGIFVLLAAASRRNITAEMSELLFHCYFPWICGLHILLDYFIDQEEDRKEGDLNFVFYYKNQEHCFQRLVFFLENALQRAEQLPDPTFHRTIINGLLALYLSDPKINKQGLKPLAIELLHSTGEKDTLHIYRLCRLLRTAGRL